MQIEQFYKRTLFLLGANAFNLENPPEVHFVSVRDLNKICLDQGFWR
jgi:hypothetical protein